MTEEIKYYKEKEYPLKWIPAEEMEETQQQTIDRLKQENNSLQAQLNNVTVQSNNAITALEQENKELKEEKLYRGIDKRFIEDANDKLYWENKKYRSALEKIRENLVKLKTNDEDDFTYEYSKIEDKINEVLGND